METLFKRFPASTYGCDAPHGLAPVRSKESLHILLADAPLVAALQTCEYLGASVAKDWICQIYAGKCHVK